MKSMAIWTSTLIVAASLVGCGGDTPRPNGCAGAASTIGCEADAGSQASNLPSCVTWGSVWWGSPDAGGTGYCVETQVALDCIAEDTNHVRHVCHCSPHPDGDVENLRCE